MWSYTVPCRADEDEKFLKKIFNQNDCITFTTKIIPKKAKTILF